MTDLNELRPETAHLRPTSLLHRPPLFLRALMLRGGLAHSCRPRDYTSIPRVREFFTLRERQYAASLVSTTGSACTKVGHGRELTRTRANFNEKSCGRAIASGDYIPVDVTHTRPRTAMFAAHSRAAQVVFGQTPEATLFPGDLTNGATHFKTYTWPCSLSDSRFLAGQPSLFGSHTRGPVLPTAGSARRNHHQGIDRVGTAGGGGRSGVQHHNRPGSGDVHAHEYPAHSRSLEQCRAPGSHSESR